MLSLRNDRALTLACTCGHKQNILYVDSVKRMRKEESDIKRYRYEDREDLKFFYTMKIKSFVCMKKKIFRKSTSRHFLSFSILVSSNSIQFRKLLLISDCFLEVGFCQDSNLELLTMFTALRTFFKNSSFH